MVLLFQGEMYVRLQNGAVLDRELNSRILTQVIARDNPNGPASNQRQRVATVTICLMSQTLQC